MNEKKQLPEQEKLQMESLINQNLVKALELIQFIENDRLRQSIESYIGIARTVSDDILFDAGVVVRVKI